MFSAQTLNAFVTSLGIERTMDFMFGDWISIELHGNEITGTLRLLINGEQTTLPACDKTKCLFSSFEA